MKIGKGTPQKICNLWWVALRIVILAGSLNGAYAAEPEPAARWSFDTLEEAKSPGEGRNALAAEVVGEVTLTNGRFGKALQFGESKGMVKIPQGMGDLAPDAFTVMFWVLLQPSKDYATLFNCNYLNGLIISVFQGWKLSVATCGQWHRIVSKEYKRMTGDWAQITYVYENETGSLYLDGVLAGRAEAMERKPKYSFNMYLGANDVDVNGKPLPQGELGSPLNGALDELRIYDQPLTEQQILAAQNQ